MKPKASSTTNDTLADDEKLARELQRSMGMEDRNGPKKQQSNQGKTMKKRRKPKPNMEELQENGICTIEQMKGTVDHMLYVLCEIDGYPAEMLIDSGASTSAISSMMMKKLNLEHKLSPQIAGNASGVGMTKILGAIENVTCSIGQGLFEFRLFFMVLDAPTIPILILGLDQMRRFKCIVDLDDNVLRFGGKDGMSVPFLSKELASQAAMTSSMVQQHTEKQQEQEQQAAMLQQQQAAAAMLQQQQQAAMLQQQAAMFQQYLRRQQQRHQPLNGNRGQGPPSPPRQQQRRREQQNPQAQQRQGQQHQSPQRRQPPQHQGQHHHQQQATIVRGNHVTSSSPSPSSGATSSENRPSGGSLMKRFNTIFGKRK